MQKTIETPDKSTPAPVVDAPLEVGFAEFTCAGCGQVRRVPALQLARLIDETRGVIVCSECRASETDAGAQRNEVEENEVERLVGIAARAIVARVGRGATVADARPLARREIERRLSRGWSVEDWAQSPGGSAVTACSMIAKRRRAAK